MENTHPNKKLNLIVGGIANQILQLLPSYEKINDLKISIITKYSEYEPLSNRLKIYEFNRFNNYTLDTIYFLIKSFLTIIKIHKKEPIDIINIHTYSNIIFTPLVIRLIFKIPILIKIPIDFNSHIRDIYQSKKHKLRAKIINYSWFKFFKTFLIKKINFIRAINNKIYKDLCNLKIPKKRILKIPNGINSKKFIDVQKKKRKVSHFGFVGRLTKFKNLRILLETFGKFLSEYPKDKLFFYGIGSERQFILKFINKNKLENNVFLCGYQNDKSKIYSNLDVLIDPALAQGISNANLEAMSSNTFVIASNVYGNKDLIKHQITGLLFNSHDKTDLLKQLLYYKENKNFVLQVINNAKNEILLNFDIDIITNQIFKFLKSKI